MNLLTPEQVAERAQLNVVTIRRLCKAGTLPAYKLAGQWRVDPDDFTAWLESSKQRTPVGVLNPSKRRARVSEPLPWGRSLRAIEGGRR